MLSHLYVMSFTKKTKTNVELTPQVDLVLVKMATAETDDYSPGNFQTKRFYLNTSTEVIYFHHH